MKVTIDGQEVKVQEEKTILELAIELDIEIPTLCHHDGLEPYGACRLCIVEIEKNGNKTIDASCTRYVEDGMVIKTATKELVEKRKLIAELLLARTTGSKELKERFEKLGITKSRFESKDYDCLLYCGRCVRVCKEKVGIEAISFVGRGYDTKVGTPFSIDSDVCIGCGACAEICPIGTIKVKDEGSTRYIEYFNTKVELKECKDCGEFFSTKKIIEKLKEDFPSFSDLDLCETCKKNNEMKKFWRVKR
ncbi:2Fe-2S iron-sulfur cluster-binding protein [Clostridium sp. DJ247]|uniref:2Fe-2S iron-sulfur cluster-binding protein n=1 Tax=Clostridium sp. DJ247 TaxID=2726188 RepID=UPI001625DFD8|nr:2Fe-2S iron-sulfur cluster-binding protein [Clostridium sp. DJ247]MBC2580510.1 2Fe-2S iron-sulfur cluster binding domain-containing protein [Clostridium sp. DJ247]